MKVGFIGLGNVGSKLSGSLLRNGVDLYVHDLSDELLLKFKTLGAKLANTPKEVMKNCEIVITCLPSTNVSADVTDAKVGLLGDSNPGKIWMELPTINEAAVNRSG